MGEHAPEPFIPDNAGNTGRVCPCLFSLKLPSTCSRSWGFVPSSDMNNDDVYSYDQRSTPTMRVP